MRRRRHIWQKLGDLCLGLAPNTSRDAVVWRVATPHDTDALGGLMLNAYRGTLDDEGETLEQACDEVRRFFDGAFGPVEALACVVGEHAGQLVSASLCCRWDGGGHSPAGPSQGRVPECAARRLPDVPAGPSQGRVPECAARRLPDVPAAPLVAYAVTAPAYQGQRLGAAAIAGSLRALAQAGHARACAVITAGNLPSEATFRRLGFEALPD